MKRSQVNQAIRWAEELLARNNIHLPDTAAYAPEKWAQIKDQAQTVFKTMVRAILMRSAACCIPCATA